MQSLIVFGEINKYLDTEIIEIESQPLWHTGQERKFNSVGEVLKLLEENTGMFEGMKEFQVYKTLCFMTDYEKKQLNKLRHLRDIYAIKGKLAMLCTSTREWGGCVYTLALPWRTNGYFSEEYGVPDDWLGIDETYVYNRLDRDIEIQEAMIKNIESVTHSNKRGSRFAYEDGRRNYKDTMDYKKIETILNRRRLSIGFYDVCWDKIGENFMIKY